MSNVPGPGRLVRVKPGGKGFLQGRRFVTPDDPPFVVEDRRAGELQRLGLVEPVTPLPVVEKADAPPRGERAVKRS